jgi:hypothetical protein
VTEKVDPKAALDQDEDRRTGFLALPAATLITGRVLAPFDLDVAALADVRRPAPA